jgi:hypothetical protein
MLVKEMEARGIGRPSTYAQIIYTLKQRKYADSVERRLVPTELGCAVTRILVENFDKLFEISFTANMEEELDECQGGPAPLLLWVERRKRGEIGEQRAIFGQQAGELRRHWAEGRRDSIPSFVAGGSAELTGVSPSFS